MRTLQYLVAAGILVAMAAASPAQAQIAGSAHNLSGGVDELCVYCHTPHNGDVSAPAPLWNRVNPTTTFTMYDSPTFDMTQQASAAGISLSCLSCHDGATSYDSIIRGTATNIGVMTGLRAVGADGLGNDHPISMTYDPAADLQNGLNAPDAGNTITGGGITLPFYGAATPAREVECATCHDPHLTTFGSFLRADNTGSAICLVCHNK